MGTDDKSKLIVLVLELSDDVIVGRRYVEVGRASGRLWWSINVAEYCWEY